jgi:hypothetical protein
MSSGEPHAKRTYLPNLKCGIGSLERRRTPSRMQLSGRFQRDASSLESIISWGEPEMGDGRLNSAVAKANYSLVLSLFAMRSGR